MAESLKQIKKDIESLSVIIDKLRGRSKGLEVTINYLTAAFKDSGKAAGRMRSLLSDLKANYDNTNAAAERYLRTQIALNQQMRTMQGGGIGLGSPMGPAYQIGAGYSGLLGAGGQHLLGAGSTMFTGQGAYQKPSVYGTGETMYAPTTNYPLLPPGPIKSPYEEGVWRDMGRYDAKMETPPTQESSSKGSIGDPFKPKQLETLAKLYPKVAKVAQKYGITMDKLTSVHREASTGITTFSLATKDANGVMNKLNITTNKTGKILQDSQKRFRGFFSTVGRNIQEALKWSIAIQLVWGPLKKLGELVETMIDNESKLANVTIALGQEQTNTAKIFALSAEIAKETGESINGVIEGYELAIRATGGIADESERAATAQQLLTDSMVLSKLSSLSQGEALDTVVGALKQMDMSLTEGMQLIDRWVQVSKSANVSVETLAESFAITATSATNAGISIEELNGIITVVAENTTLSATESGNAVRAFISGFQTDKAVKQLGQFGIAVETVTDGTIGFYQVMKQVYELYDADIISDSQLNKIGEAIGGGARRGAQVVATIKNLARVQEVVEAQADSHGAAEEALGIKLDTVKTKAVELSNAFQSLGQSLGEEGGMIDALKLVFNLGTGLINMFSDLSDIMGEALPIAIALGIALKLMTSGGGFGVRLQGGITGINKILGKVGAGSGAMGMIQSLGYKTGMGIPMTAASVGMNLVRGEPEQAGGAAAGGIAGMLLGGLLGPLGATIGSVIGSAIGDAFIGNVVQHEGKWEDLFKISLTPPKDTTAEESKNLTEAERIAKEQEALMEKVTGGFWKRVAAAGLEATSDLLLGVSQVWGEELWGAPTGGNITREQASLALTKDPKIFDEIRRLNAAAEAASGKIVSKETSKQQISDARKYKEELNEIVRSTREWGIESLVAGEISNKHFKDLKDSLIGMSATLTGWGATFGDEYITATGGINSMTDAYKDFAEIISRASAEELGVVGGFYSELTNLQHKIEQAQQYGYADFAGEKLDPDQLINIESGTLDTLNKYIQRVLEEIRRVDLTIPARVDLSGFDQGQIDSILAWTEEEMRRVYSQAVSDGFLEGISFEDWKSTFDSFYIDSGRMYAMRLVEGVDQSMLSEIISQKTSEGLLNAGGLGMQYFDMTRPELEARAAKSIGLEPQFKAAGAETNIETVMAVTADGIIGAVTAEQFIMQLLMKELIDVNEKQLEGIYNLPSDASFYVPFTGYTLGQGGGGGGGGGGWTFEELIPYQQEIANNTAMLVSQGTVEPYELSEELRKRIDPTPTEVIAKSFTPEMEKSVAMEEWMGVPYKLPEGPPYESEYFRPGEDITPYDVEGIQGGTLGEVVEKLSGIEVALDAMGQGQIESAKIRIDAWQPLIDLLTAIFGGIFGSDEANSGASGIKVDEKLKPIETSLSLDVNQTTTLLLDGEQVAQVISNYLYDDLIVSEESTSVARTVIL
jgi:TP901 family phage tail tape measure protein